MKQRARQEIPKGTKFGVLTFLHEEPQVKQNNVWRRLAMVKCICGEEKLVQLANLQSIASFCALDIAFNNPFCVL